MAEGFKRGARKLGDLVQVNGTDGSLVIVQTGPGMTNPMLAVGDVIYGGVGGTPQRRIIGAAGQVLTVSGGNPVWADLPADDDSLYIAASVMSANGDLITRAAGIPARIAIGTTGQRLTVVAGAAAWAAGNPMTTQDDIIYGGASGVETRLAKGADSQVLTVDPADHHVKWMAAASGFSNPMTTKGDIIIGDTGGAAIRLAGSGTDAWVLTYDAGTAQPKWAASAGGGGSYPPTSWASLVKFSGPSGYWDFLGKTGTSQTFNDQSGETNLATTDGGVTSNNSGGPFGGGYISLSSGQITFAKIPRGAGTIYGYTLEFWLYSTGTTFLGLIDTAPSAGGSHRNYNTGFYERQGGASVAFPAVTANTWTHIAIVVWGAKDNSASFAGTLELYKNGALSSATTFDTTAPAWATGWTLGSINGGGAGYFAGRLAHFAYYARPLTPSEMAFHYTNGAAD